MRSTSSQASMAVQVATVVLMKVTRAVVLAASAEPALKPNQPNHSSPAPSTTSGRLCGFIASLPKPSRGPSTSTSASPETPQLISTTVPPAKSSAPSFCVTQPPGPHTQCATGTYTSSV